jgi:pimeloyl-ACP methyl ester carboxylesterase
MSRPGGPRGGARALRGALIASMLVGASACQMHAPTDTPQPGSGVVDLKLPDGEVQRVLYVEPEHPKAVIVPLLGGDGWLFIDGAGETTPPYFLVSRRDLWLAQGIAVAAIHTAEPIHGNRLTERSVRTVQAVVAYLHTRTDAPIWLVGHSNGAISAVNDAARLTHGEIAGLVLLSSVTRLGSSNAGTVFGAGLDRVTVPTLIVSHADDPCIATPPADAPLIRVALTKAPKSEVMIVNGGTAGSPYTSYCGGSAHSFAGMHPELIERVATWIKAQPVD